MTGAAGFIASRVCEFLLADGHTVVGVDNLNDYYDVRLKYYRLARLAEQGGCAAADVAKIKELVTKAGGPIIPFQVSALKSERFEFRALDIENLTALADVFQAYTFDAVFNLAARAGVRASLENPEVYRRTNVVGEENVLKCQVQHGVKKHILASSSSVYAGCPMPFREDAVLGEPQSPYAATKRQAELLARQYHEEHGLDVSVLRYFTVFGPAGRPDMAPFRFIKWIAEGTPITLYGDGTQARDFTYVDDIARGTILAGRVRGEQSSEIGNRRLEIGGASSPNRDLRIPDSDLQTTGYEVINLGGGNNPISLQTVIALVETMLGKKAKIVGKPLHAADIKKTWADISTAGRLLGWVPQISPEDGFHKTVSWYLDNRNQLLDIRL